MEDLNNEIKLDLLGIHIESVTPNMGILYI